MSAISRILIAGGSGFVGQHLTQAFVQRGIHVSILGRNKPEDLSTHGASDFITWKAFSSVEGYDAIINLTGAGIADKRWSQRYKKTLLNSRINTTRALVHACLKAKKPPPVFINASAIGFYGHQGDAAITEQTPPAHSFSHQLCSQWEEVLKPLQTHSRIRTCIARLGVVLAKEGGAFEKIRKPFEMKCALYNGDGQQWFSWIAIEDVISAMAWLIETETASGIYNLTAPTPVTNNDFTQQLGQHYKTLVTLPLPKFMIKSMLGEMGEELLLASQRVLPEKLNNETFQFKHSTLDNWLKSIA